MYISLLTMLAILLALFSTNVTGMMSPLGSNTNCTVICSPMSNLTSGCGYSNTAGMMGSQGGMMRQCICQNTSFNVRSLAALCASCIQEKLNTPGMGMGMGTSSDMEGNVSLLNNRSSRFSNFSILEMSGIMSACQFSSTSYTPAATSVVAGIHVVVSPAASTTGASSATATSAKSAASRHGMEFLGLAAAAGAVVVFRMGTGIL